MHIQGQHKQSAQVHIYTYFLYISTTLGTSNALTGQSECDLCPAGKKYKFAVLIVCICVHLQTKF